MKRFEFPGFVDVHVHFRDPGFTEAETVTSGLTAASRGGFAAVVTMPNTNPACDSEETIRHQTSLGESFGGAPLLLASACITRFRAGEKVADLERLAEAGAAFFTDDGSYVCSDAVMEEAMRRSAELCMVVSDHALDPRIVGAGVIRDCPLARRLGLEIIPAEAEIAAVRRDISLCRETGCRLHIQHISTAQAVSLVRDAQKEGLPVTAEATPHHLLFACDDIEVDDANFKMAPPLGCKEDRAELRKAVKEGVLMFATDHAPHPAHTKSLGFAKSGNGILGLETAVAVTYSVMVEEEGMSIDDWVKAWHDMPLSLLPPSLASRLVARTAIEIGENQKIDISTFASLSRNCPYDGMSFNAKAYLVK